MKKLKLEDLAPYLPYGLRVEVKYHKINSTPAFFWKKEILSIELMNEVNVPRKYTGKAVEYKPILRPLSDLKTRIHKEESTTFLDWIETEYDIYFFKMFRIDNINKIPHEVVEYLLEWHFDIFGLIEKGLAIDINTLNQIK